MSLIQEYKDRIIKDLKSLNIDTEGFKLVLKPFSKSYYGRYKVSTKTIWVYIYADKQCTKLYPYDRLFETVLHECVHHIQWSDPHYIRVKGVMHNPEFYLIYNRLIRKYRIYKIIKHRRC